MSQAATAIKERPILFSSPMVKAILDGRKTQTRRIVKNGRNDIRHNKFVDFTAADPSGFWGFDDCNNPILCVHCPYGSVGDRLWVRETFSIEEGSKDHTGKDPDFIQYKADEIAQFLDEDGMPTGEFAESDNLFVLKWKPSIFMPRSASRINLEITGVRVERLHNITQSDAIAEGIESVPDNFGNGPAYCDYSMGKLDDTAGWFAHPVNSFASLWESINGAGSWAANPWVWVVEVKKSS